MIYAWAAILVLVNLFWLFLVIFGLPGTWLMVITTAVFAVWQGHGGSEGHVLFGATTLAILIGLALVGELIEFVAGVAGAKKAGGGWRGAIGALLGGLIGGLIGTFLIPIPIIGSLAGACIGAGLGAWWMELRSRDWRLTLQSPQQRWQRATQIGYAAGVGRFMGTLGKLMIAILMWLVIAVAAFVP